MSRYLPTREDGKPVPAAPRPDDSFFEERTDPMVRIPSTEELLAELSQHAEAGQGLDDDFWRGPL